MQRWRSLGDIPANWGRCAVSIGVFDGVHRGHAELIARAVHEGHQRGVPTVVLTFEPHPAEVLSPGRGPAQLTTTAHRADLFEGLGVAAMLALPFTQETAALSPQAFVADVLAGALHADVVVVGANFTFGYRAAGTVADLARLGSPLGITTIGLPLVEVGPAAVGPAAVGPAGDGSGAGAGDGVVSATRARARLADGDVEGVSALLGRPFRADGVVVRGEHRGRALGYPTANLDLATRSAVPADGVYAGRVVRLDPDGSASSKPALGVGAISVGTNPTFDGVRRTVEVFILDFDGDLYGDRLGVEFWHRLRGQVRFDSVDELITQMGKDVARTREMIKYF